MNESRRVDYLDMVKGIGIILVVAGHCGYLAKDALTVIYSFHMPLFFIVSGMISCYRRDELKPLKQVIVKRLKSLMIPYAIFSLIYLAIYGGYFCYVAGYLTPEMIMRYAIQAVSLDGMSVLWFLSALFLAELIFFCIRKAFGKRVTYLLCFVLMIAVSLLKRHILGVFSVDSLWQTAITGFISAWLRGMIGAGFFAMGYATMEVIHAVDEKCVQTAQGQNRERIRKLLELLGGIVLLAATVGLSLYNGNVELRSMTFGKLPIYFVCAYIGTLAMIMICRGLPKLRWLSYLGINSMIIMVTHLDCQYMLISVRVGKFFVSLSPYAKWYCLYFGMILSMTALELVTIYLINHFAPFLIGRYKRKNEGIWKNEGTII